MGERLYNDMSISEVRLHINMIRRSLIYIQHKDINNPMNGKDYDLLKNCIREIEKIDGCRWTKEFY